jgi:hypothetical protein
VIGGNLIPSRFFKEAGLIFKGSYQQDRSPQGQSASFTPTLSSRLGVVHPNPTGTTNESTTKPEGKTTWKVGDACVHETFGKGIVTQILSTDIIEIQFEQPPLRKKIIAQHPKLNKVK